MFEDDELLEQTSSEDESTERTSSETTDEPDAAATEQQTSETAEAKDVLRYTVRGKDYEIDRSEIDVATIQKGKDYDHVKTELEETHKTSAETKANLERLTAALSQFGYAGSPQEIADALEAQQREVQPEQVRREREMAQAQQIAQTEAEAAKLEVENIRKEAVFAHDLAEIQKLNPNVQSLSELGDKFFKLRAAGIGNLEAYELLNHKPVVKPSAAGKDHLLTTGGGASAGGLADIPKGELTMWKDSFPDDTPAKLKERYNRSLKRQGD